MAQYKDFIPQNAAPPNARRIGIYNSKGNRVGFVPLGSLTPPAMGRKQYSFGALSDVHGGRNLCGRNRNDHNIKGGIHMISAWHLIWIIPLSASAGAFCMALVAAGNRREKDDSKTETVSADLPGV